LVLFSFFSFGVQIISPRPSNKKACEFSQAFFIFEKIFQKNLQKIFSPKPYYFTK